MGVRAATQAGRQILTRCDHGDEPLHFFTFETPNCLILVRPWAIRVEQEWRRAVSNHCSSRSACMFLKVEGMFTRLERDVARPCTAAYARWILAYHLRWRQVLEAAE